MLTQEMQERVRAEALEHMRRANMKEHVATIMAARGKEKWPVRITLRAGEYFEVSGRSTRMDVYLAETNSGYLVSIPNFQRCGVVPGDCSLYDVQEFIGIDNKVDATTLAVALRYLIDNGKVEK
ncbi:hypothetical protein SDD30_08165 [Moorella naiadis]|uniref:hypothetical protein n=1 Tax=Moorella naiadis (nom. illeg.) TaxID=3093670 RepID=UPI003D9C9822